MPVDPNGPMVLTGSPSAAPVLVPLEEEPHVITKIIGISVMCIGGMQIVGSLFSFGTIGLNSWLSTMGPEVEEALLPSWYYAATGLIAIVAGAIFLYSGYQIKTYQKRVFGLHLEPFYYQTLQMLGLIYPLNFHKVLQKFMVELMFNY